MVLMNRSFLAAAVVVAAAVPLSADTLADVKAALRNLRGTQPIRAAYETKSANVAKGRFFDQDVSTTGNVEARVDDSGITIVYPRALLDRAAAQRDAKKDDIKQRVADVSATRIAEMLDYAPALSSVLDRAVVVEDRAGAFNGQPVRLLVMNVKQRDDVRVKTGHVDIKVDRLSLWIGADSIPLYAERVTKFTAGVLFLKAEGQSTEKSTFVRRDDRLVEVKHEHEDQSAGMGQTSHNTETEVITLR
jgi:hypothetical protein